MSKKVTVTNFDNRGTKAEPFGFIEFSDGMRIGYAPGTDRANEDGLFDSKQKYNMGHLELRAAHVTAATEFVREHLKKDSSTEEQPL